MIKKYIKEISAVQYDGSNNDEIRELVSDNNFWVYDQYPVPVIAVRDNYSGGRYFPNVRDFIVKDINGDIYVCKEEFFYKNYKLKNS